MALGDVMVRVVESRQVLIADRLGPASKAKKCIAEIVTTQRDTPSPVGKGWMFGGPIYLPRKLGECVQNLEYNEIRVSHQVEVIIPVKELASNASEVRPFSSK
jgi:hypothetical protein